jgi:aryl-alcohol dehydrogenase-like predicted oxidoreductase
METRSLGATGLRVSPVGFGAGSIGEESTSEAEVDQLLGAALDAGVTLVDTARSYGLSEERLGRLLEGRRERVVLSTKVGYGTPGIPDWTAPCIEAGVDAALRRLRTDWIDVVHLHSCGLDVLQRGEVVDALHRAVAAGKVRVAAYSGENEALQWAVESGAFGSIQCSVSVVDQTVLGGAVAQARARGLGVLAKRALGNAPWRFATRPEAEDVAEATLSRAVRRARRVVGGSGADGSAGRDQLDGAVHPLHWIRAGRGCAARRHAQRSAPGGGGGGGGARSARGEAGRVVTRRLRALRHRLARPYLNRSSTGSAVRSPCRQLSVGGRRDLYSRLNFFGNAPFRGCGSSTSPDVSC